MISRFRVMSSSSKLLVIWGLVVGSGIVLLEIYTARPGEAGSPPVLWPEKSLASRDVCRPTLLIFLHPRCRCSRASVAELGTIPSRMGHRVPAHALLFTPTHFPEGRGRSMIEDNLAAFHEVQTWPDREGVEATRSRGATSGHVMLYDERGRLAYSGGITSARGHRGDNDGRAAVIDRILNKGGHQWCSPVFGCPLSASGSPANGELGQ
jgi:hypothetical protein